MPQVLTSYGSIVALRELMLASRHACSWAIYQLHPQKNWNGGRQVKKYV